MLEVQRWPELSDTLLVVALSGWVDAGTAGAAAAAFTVEQLDGARSFARVPLAEHVDLQQTRPTVHLDGGVTRSIGWPEIELVAGRADRDVVVVRGPEPSLRWPAVIAALVGAGQRLDVREVITLGGMPAAVSHRQPTEVLATTSSRELADEIGALRADYEGPTGAQTALAVAFAHQGTPAVGLWAQVPHYLAGSTAPTAVRALSQRLAQVGGIRLDSGALDPPCAAWLERVEESLAERPEVAELVEQIEAAHAELPGEDLPTGDELAGEIERFLREER